MGDFHIESKHLIWNPPEAPPRSLSIGWTSVSGAEALAEAPSCSEMATKIVEREGWGEMVFSGDTSSSLTSPSPWGRNYQIISLSASSQPRGTVEVGNQSVCQLISSENGIILLTDHKTIVVLYLK